MMRIERRIEIIRNNSQAHCFRVPSFDLDFRDAAYLEELETESLLIFASVDRHVYFIRLNEIDVFEILNKVELKVGGKSGPLLKQCKDLERLPDLNDSYRYMMSCIEDPFSAVEQDIYVVQIIVEKSDIKKQSVTFK